MRPLMMAMSNSGSTARDSDLNGSGTSAISNSAIAILFSMAFLFEEVKSKKVKVKSVESDQ